MIVKKFLMSYLVFYGKESKDTADLDFSLLVFACERFGGYVCHGASRLNGVLSCDKREGAGDNFCVPDWLRGSAGGVPIFGQGFWEKVLDLYRRCFGDFGRKFVPYLFKNKFFLSSFMGEMAHGIWSCLRRDFNKHHGGRIF